MDNDPTPPKSKDVNLEDLQAIVDALGVLTMAITTSLPASQQEPFALALARLGKALSASGRSKSDALIGELHRAARMSVRGTS